MSLIAGWGVNSWPVLTGATRKPGVSLIHYRMSGNTAEAFNRDQGPRAFKYERPPSDILQSVNVSVVWAGQQHGDPRAALASRDFLVHSSK